MLQNSIDKKYDWIEYFKNALLHILVVVVEARIKYKICKICC